MKQKNKVKRLAFKQAAYDKMLKDTQHPVTSAAYHRPGSVKK